MKHRPPKSLVYGMPIFFYSDYLLWDWIKEYADSSPGYAHPSTLGRIVFALELGER